MNSCFEGAAIYLQLGREHILDLQGYDHILFVLALCAAYRPAEWRQVLVLVTAFTLGHSLTLALAVYDLFRLPAPLVEALIPATILATALANLWRGGGPRTKGLLRLNYLLALLFGFIHGMGFSNYLRSLLPAEGCIGGPLFFFNLGIELGQLLIVAAAMLASGLLTGLARLPQRWWNISLSAAAGLAALFLLAGRI
jgi:hypothetical protein